MPSKGGRPTSERGKALASKERALAHLRWHQLRILRREYKPVADFETTVTAMLALPDRLNLTAEQRNELRKELAAMLQACAKTEL